MKLAPRQYGPFKIVAKISNVAYKIQLLTTWKIHDVFHASLLTPYNETNAHGPNFLEPPPDLIEGEPEWEVEMILGDKIYKKKKQYLIRWKGYAPAHDLWEDESEIHAPKLIADYKLQKLWDQSAPQSAHQSVLAKTPQPQSAPTRRRHQTRIRTLEVLPRTRNPLVHVPPRQRHTGNHRSTGTTDSDPAPLPPCSSSLSRPPWKANHRSRLEDLAEKNVSDWVCSIGLTVEQADQSRTPSPSSSSSKCIKNSWNNSETHRPDHSPATTNQCHSLVSQGQNSQQATRNVGSSAYSSLSKMNGTRPEPTKGSPLPPSTSPNGMKTMPYSCPPSTPKYTNEYSKTIHSASTTHNPRAPDGTKLWKITPTFERGSSVGETENPDYASTLRRLKKQSWQENSTAPSGKKDTNSAACATN
jgi:Chromo (CHRromatin Organisation MOdifier) domain